MSPSIGRVTIVLYSQSNTVIRGGPHSRVDKPGREAYVNPLHKRAPVMHVNTVITGWTAALDDACLELHFWRHRDERLTDRGRNKYRRAIETTIMDTKGISILPEIRCWKAFCDRLSKKNVTKPNTTTKPRPGYGSRSVRDKSTLGRYDGWVSYSRDA
jgi:hypothetical protein